MSILFDKFAEFKNGFIEDNVASELWRFLPGLLGWLICIATVLYYNWPDGKETRFQVTQRSKKNANIKVGSIWVYPIKSCRGIKLQSTAICKTGFEHDRTFMLCSLTREEGEDVYKMLTIRNMPRMALIDTAIKGGTLIASIDGQHKATEKSLTSTEISLDYKTLSQNKQVNFKLHKTPVVGSDLGESASAFFSDFLGCPVRLLRCVEGTRQTKGFPNATSDVAFADRYPLLVSSELSLADLNDKMKKAGESSIEDERMRPNLILTGTEKKFDEENWKRMLVNDNKIYLIAKCTRCGLPSVDLNTGIKNVNNQPKKLVTENYDACFGMHALVYGQTGEIKVGDSVQVVD